MAKNKGGRSSFSLLPWDLRYTIMGALHDGFTFEAICTKFGKEYASRGLNLTRSAVSRIKKTKEYREYVAKRLKMREAETQDRLTRELLQETGALENAAEQTKVALMRALADLSNLNGLEEEERVKALRSITQSVTALSNQQKDDRILRQQGEIERLQKEIADQQERYGNETDRLTEKIAELEKMIPGVDSGEVAKAMDEKFLKQG